MKPVRVLIVGTGKMAADHRRAYADMAGVEVVAGVDVSAQRLAAFNAEHNIARGFSSVEEAIQWGEFDAVSNVTPDVIHHASTMPLLAAGKHVLCEKPLATNATDAAEMAAAAAKAGVVNMINLTYRNVASMRKAASLVREGVIGQVRFFEASYLQSWLTQPAWGDWKTQDAWLWRLSTAHGSKGALGDIGIHILDFTTFIAGEDVRDVSGRLATYDKAEGGQIGEYVLDANDSATMQVSLQNGALGTISVTRFASGHINDLRVRIYGDEGGLEVNSAQHSSELRLCLKQDLQQAVWRDVDSPPVTTNYQRFIAAIRGEAEPEPDFSRGAALQKVLDAVEESAQRSGLVIKI